MANCEITTASRGKSSTTKDENKKDSASLCQTSQLPAWILAWFYVTAVVCTWDATFIMLRPQTLPGGSLAWLWYPYKYYIVVDQRYKDTEDAFVFAQSLLNYVEIIFNVITIVMHYKRSIHTCTTGFTVSVMTMWKTVLYFLMFSEFCTGGVYRQGNTLLQEIFLVVLPNIFWIIVPLAAMVGLWPLLTPPQPTADNWVSETDDSKEFSSSIIDSMNGSKMGTLGHGEGDHNNLRTRKINIQG